MTRRKEEVNLTFTVVRSSIKQQQQQQHKQVIIAEALYLGLDNFKQSKSRERERERESWGEGWGLAGFKSYEAVFVCFLFFSKCFPKCAYVYEEQIYFYLRSKLDV